MSASSSPVPEPNSTPARGPSVTRLILRELRHRTLNATLSAGGIITAVALVVFYFTTAKAADRETKRVTRDIGFNLRIIPKETDLDRFWVQGFSELTIAEDAVHRLADSHNVFLSYNHLVASLQQHWPLQGRDVILTGLAPAITAPAQRKRPMGFSIDPGTVHVGHQVAQRLDLSEGDTLALGTNVFSIVRCLAEAGNEDDIRVYGLLSDVQRVLDLEGRINEIKAIDCLCLTADEDPLGQLRAVLAETLPEAKVLQMRSIADARARQRQMTNDYFVLFTSVLLVVCALWIAVLAILNVRERRREIGILRALGFGSLPVACLFLGKALFLGLVGAVLGFALGSALALSFGPDVFQITAKAIRLESSLLWGALALAPCLALLATLLPTLLAVTQDPSESLRVD